MKIIITENQLLKLIKENNKLRFKRLGGGVYYETKTKKYISSYKGTKDRVWNIYNDEYCIDEYAVGFPTIDDARYYLEQKLEKENEDLVEQKSGVDAILVGGLDYRRGDKNIGEQVELLKSGFGTNKNVIGFKYNTSTSTILNFLKQHPNTPVFLFSAGCKKAEELAKSDFVNLDNLFIIEPFAAGSSTKISVRNAVGLGVPSRNVFVGNNSGRGLGIVNGASSSQSKTHWGALQSVGSMARNKVKPKSWLD